MTTSLPIQQKERVVIVDVLRGFALFGVLIGNFNGMLTNHVPSAIISSISTPFDHFLDDLHSIFIQNKFMTLFSILFGYGFGVIMERVAKKNLNTTRFFLRRMFWLFVFGCIHLAFWAADILHVYAFAGIFLLLFRKKSDRSIFVWSLLFMFVFPFVTRICQQYMSYSPDYDSLTQNVYNTIRYGTIKDVAILNYTSYPKLWIYTFIDLRDGCETLGRFLFGYYILRRQILVQPGKYKWLIKRVWKVSLVGLLVYIALWLLRDLQILTAKLLIYPLLKLGIFAAALFYSTSIIFLFEGARLTKLMKAFSDLGRMTLTNYLMESFVYIIIFYNIGFGLLGEWSLTTIWVAALVLYFLQIIFSRWWLSKFAYGPVEWIWRQLAYQKRFPIRDHVSKLHEGDKNSYC
jgi:uncharacterized protein